MKKMSKFDLRLLPPLPLTQVNTESGRHYVLPDCDIKFTSVTTFLSKTSDDSFLETWKKRVGEEEAKVISAKALDRGNTIHGYLEKHIIGHPYKLDKYALQFDCIRKYLDRNLTTVFGIENKMYSKEMQLAGTTDLFGIYKGKNSIVDFKGSNKPKQLKWITSYILQCLIYSKMVKECFDIDIEQLVILVGVDKAYKAQEFIISLSQFEEYELELKERLVIWNNLSNLS
jgi:hypothetical protein